MATQTARIAASDSLLPRYRMDVDTYHRLVEAGALEGLEVELRDGLLVDCEHCHGHAVHRLDTDTYNRMVATGALEGERVELLEGLLVEVSPHSPEHATMIEELTARLAGARASLRVQLPLEVRLGSEPEPDLALIEQAPPPRHHPQTLLLAVEVAVSSHARDREVKAGLYAEAGVPKYWLVDVPGRTVEVRTDPGPKGYGRCEVYGVGALVPSPAEGVPDLGVGSLFAVLGDGD
jgi:Uma2 family endonuclease